MDRGYLALIAIGYIARYPHLLRHLQPILNELERRGHPCHEGPGDVTLTAARYDAEQIQTPCVLVEHGAGQTYQIAGIEVDGGSANKASPTYRHVVLYVGPNQRTCDLMARWLPNAEMVVASPLVEWMRLQTWQPSTVVFAVHWPSPLAASVPEAGTSWPESAFIAKALQPDVLHCHPRIAARFTRDLKHKQVPGVYVADWDEVWPTARLLVVDNSSIMWEAAAVGIDVAVIQPSHWTGRHGLRFGVVADPLIRVDEGNAQEVRGRVLPKPAGTPYEVIGGSAALTVDAILKFT